MTAVSLPPVNLHQRFRRFEAPAIPKPTDFRLGEPPTLALIGYGIPAGRGVPGEDFPITLYWQALDEPAQDYTVFVQLLTGDWQVVAQQDMQPLAGEAPTGTWLPEEILIDPYHLILPADLPAGNYRLIAGMYDPISGQRLPVSNADGKSLGDFVDLGIIGVP